MSKCASLTCTKPASSLQCPICLKAGRSGPETFFCSQDCFKHSYSLHKQLHEYNPYPGFKYTGPLRPFPQSPTRTLPAHIPRPDYAETGIPKSEYEQRRLNQIQPMLSETVTRMRAVCQIGRLVLEEAKAAIKPGITTDEIDRIVHEKCIELGAYPSPLNYQGFPKSCCTSVNEVICHGIPDMRPLQDGDICNVDVSVFKDGLHADLNETVAVGGGVDARGLELIACARECLDRAIAIVKPGRPYREIGDVIEAHAQSKGFSVVRTYCGHGIGELFHDKPTIPHYGKNKGVGVMRVGHVFTIEPMINEGSWHDLLWPDDWTAVTRDGKRSAQFEETLIVTEEGCEVLTRKQ